MFLGPNFEIEIMGLDRIGKGFHSLFYNLLNSENVIRSLMRAEHEGYSGAAIGCFIDPGLEEAREILKIPVAGMGEVALQCSKLYGKKIAIVNNSIIETNKFILKMPQRYRFKNAECNVIGFDLPAGLLNQCFTKPEPVVKAFTDASHAAIDNGSDIIIPGCGIINMVLVKNGINRIEGIPIFDTTGMLIRMIETMILLKEISGLDTSRKGFYEPPPDSKLSEIA
jgi:Asp/Glu/hydantoin racemase